MKEFDDFLLYVASDGGTWIFLEPENRKISLEDSIMNGEKYVIHGSKEYVENLAKILEKKIGGVIDSLKYSRIPVSETPKNEHSLIVYFDRKNREKVMEILKENGVECFEWKSNRQSWLEALDNPFFSLLIYLTNPKGLRKVSKILGKPEAYENAREMMSICSEYARKFRKMAKLIKEYKIQKG